MNDYRVIHIKHSYPSTGDAIVLDYEIDFGWGKTIQHKKETIMDRTALEKIEEAIQLYEETGGMVPDPDTYIELLIAARNDLREYEAIKERLDKYT